MKTFLHVGCGLVPKEQTTRGFGGGDWTEMRFDIDSNVGPDIVGTMIDMSAVPSASVDAIFSSHNIEHLYPHEVPVALREFLRVLKPGGFAVIVCPDLQSVCAAVAEDKLDDMAYLSPAGPIAPLDMLYGLRSAMAAGNYHMAHRGGFTQRTLGAALQAAGFANGALNRRVHPHYDLWAVATKSRVDDAAIRDLAVAHFPA
jgi:SAM-dependent methyltransferase